MQIVLRPRQQGKTTELIRQAMQTNGYIVCHSERECDRVFQHAQKLGFNIRMPITWRQFVEDRGAYSELEYHIDNLDMCLESMTNKKIFSVSLTEQDL